MSQTHRYSYWGDAARQFRRHLFGTAALIMLSLFILVAIYAPLLASSKPLFVIYEGVWYFPLCRYLFYSNFFTKHLDLFFNLMMITFPLMIIARTFPYRRLLMIGIILFQLGTFLYLFIDPVKDPAVSPLLNQEKQKQVQLYLKEARNPQSPLPKPFNTWSFDLAHMTSYAKLNMLVAYRLEHEHDETLQTLTGSSHFESRWQQNQHLLQQQRENTEEFLKNNKEHYLEFKEILARGGALSPQQRQQVLAYEQNATKNTRLFEKEKWLKEESQKLRAMTMPLFRPFHWEDDAGGDQSLNHALPWYELTRTNRKDLVAALIFGIRISLVVGTTSVLLAFLIGLPIGSLAGFYGGRFDIIVCRLIEIWESMPLFFMLLLVVAITQSKSIFLVITVIGLFGWIPFCRYTRGEFFKQRNLPYVEACHSLGFSDARTIFSHILPNAIPPLLTLMPFSIMGAMTSEAALSFLGLGEEGSCSWGVLMDEGRNAFPGESYLLWPPAVLLTILLIAIALVGDALRDALDPKLN